LADILQNSTFDGQEVEKERGVILQEVAMTSDTPDDIIFDYFQEKAFPKQPLGRSILGKINNIKTFNSQHFQSYINNQYNYQNMAIVASGSVKTSDVVNWVDKYFNQLNSNIIDKPKQPKYVGGVAKKVKKLEQVHLVLGFEGLSYHNSQFYTQQILAMILGSGMSSRLFYEIRENLGLAYSVYAFNSCYSDAGIFGIYGGTSIEKLDLFLQATKQELIRQAGKKPNVAKQIDREYKERKGVRTAKPKTPKVPVKPRGGMRGGALGGGGLINPKTR
jgi:predicted Zn-dependent peptidase